MNKLEGKNNINTMILCAGRGQRMRYKTKYIAKPLIKILNQPILKTNINYLSSMGVKNCIINNSYNYLTIQKLEIGKSNLKEFNQIKIKY